jgi:hypothetical protein
MQTKLSTLLLAACLAVSALPAAAQSRSEAKLATPAASPTTATIDGVAWRCDGDACVGVGERRSGLDSLMKECRKVAAAVGPITAYSSRGRSLTERNVATCNRLAAQAKPASELAEK